MTRAKSSKVGASLQSLCLLVWNLLHPKLLHITIWSSSSKFSAASRLPTTVTVCAQLSHSYKSVSPVRLCDCRLWKGRSTTPSASPGLSNSSSDGVRANDVQPSLRPDLSLLGTQRIWKGPLHFILVTIQISEQRGQYTFYVLWKIRLNHILKAKH